MQQSVRPAVYSAQPCPGYVTFSILCLADGCIVGTLWVPTQPAVVALSSHHLPLTLALQWTLVNLYRICCNTFVHFSLTYKFQVVKFNSTSTRHIAIARRVGCLADQDVMMLLTGMLQKMYFLYNIARVCYIYVLMSLQLSANNHPSISQQHSMQKNLERELFVSPFVHRGKRNEPMHEPKAFLKLSLDTTMLFVPIRYPHTPLPSCFTCRMCLLITCPK